MKRFVLILGMALMALGGTAQLDIIERKHAVRLFYYFSSQQQTGAENISESGSSFDAGTKKKYSTWGIGFSWERNRADRGAFSFRYLNRFSYDFLTTIYQHLVNDENQVDELNHYPMTGGFFGEFRFGWNIMGGDKMRLMAGMHIGDYAISSHGWENGRYDLNESDGLNGWYGGVGPDVIFSYTPIDFLVVSVPFSLSFTIPIAKEDFLDPTPEYLEEVNPLILNTGVEIMSRLGFYVHIDYLKPISGHQTSVSRTDVNIGYAF